jgi:hypothetical protein
MSSQHPSRGISLHLSINSKRKRSEGRNLHFICSYSTAMNGTGKPAVHPKGRPAKLPGGLSASLLRRHNNQRLLLGSTGFEAISNRHKPAAAECETARLRASMPRRPASWRNASARRARRRRSDRTASRSRAPRKRASWTNVRGSKPSAPSKQRRQHCLLACCCFLAWPRLRNYPANPYPINAARAEFVHRSVDRARSKAPSHTNHGTEQRNRYDDSAGQYGVAARVRHSPGLRSLD